jgi:hypothetical protein
VLETFPAQPVRQQAASHSLRAEAWWSIWSPMRRCRPSVQC